jgi:hypothetical protein
MAQRNFRSRPIDFHKHLDIVRDESLLDSTEGLPAREVAHSHTALDADNEKVSIRLLKSTDAIDRRQQDEDLALSRALAPTSLPSAFHYRNFFMLVLTLLLSCSPS